MSRLKPLLPILWMFCCVAALGTPGDTLTRLEYQYDVAGNRTEAVRTPRPVGGVDLATKQEQTNEYDQFNRLVNWLAEHVDAQSTPSLLRNDLWSLDLLGNWKERETSLLSGPTRWVEHAVDGRNQITALLSREGIDPTVETHVRYDDAGNLIFDGTHAFQYDGWNRLV
jgi:hypothetical protein